MTTECDLDELKHQAVQKFIELANEETIQPDERLSSLSRGTSTP